MIIILLCKSSRCKPTNTFFDFHKANTGPVTFAPLFQGFNPSSSTNHFNRPPVSSPAIATTAAPVSSTPFTTTTDPDDVIYSDELKPVHEDYDPITDPYISNKLPSG